MQRVAVDELPEAWQKQITAVVSPPNGRFVAAGEKIPRKGGPGITKSDLFVINKTDLAPYVGVDLGVMEADTKRMRKDKPFVMTNLKTRTGLAEVVAFIERKGMLVAPA